MRAKDELEHISNKILEDEEERGQCIPLRRDIFQAFRVTRPEDVRVCIIGMDPYPTILPSGPQAMGMSFSARKGEGIPASLGNIFKELKNSVTDFEIPNHGDLTSWAEQGVLLLNASLTVRPGNPGSHGGIWLGFLDHILKEVAAQRPNCIYLLWGRDAQALASMLGNKSVIFEATHPSPMSAYRGFFGCNHFNMVNDKLVEMGEEPIDWSL